jgi:F-type H+-transporting ATPase subunit a
LAAENSPLHQFTIETLVPIHIGGVDASFTNASLLMCLAVLASTAFVVLGMSGAKLVPGRWQSMAELAYEFVANMVEENVGHEGKPYFPFLFSLFMFVLLGNLLGMIPFSFTFTSHIIVTFALAAVVFVGVTLIGIFKHGIKFLTLFAPHGVPTPLLILLVPIEVLSYFIRPFTLSIRLFANMMAGHTMLYMFASFVVPLAVIGYGVSGLGPLAMDIFLVLLEFLVAVLQAYVFTILSSLYLKDALHLH